jgi:hypothetical protein
VVVATDALRESFVFPAQDTRQGHLGFLLAWLGAVKDRAARMAAAEEAERATVATSLDPEFEREVLAPRVEAFNAAREKDAAALARAADEIRRPLEEELTRRFRLTERARDTLRRDTRRPNRGLKELIQISNDQHAKEYLRLEDLRALDVQREAAGAAARTGKPAHCKARDGAPSFSATARRRPGARRARGQGWSARRAPGVQARTYRQ